MESSSFCDNYIDISPLLHSKSAVFPGDTTFTHTINMSMNAGDNLDLSDIKTTLHIGAHADAPSHYNQKGETIEQRSLTPYMGAAQVIEVQIAPGERIGINDFSVEIKAPRVLFKTNSFPDSDFWNEDFNSLSPELIEHLHSLGVVLVGIDTPSVDPSTDKELPSHQALFKTNMAVLEGIVLSHVPDGLYDLMALPLKIANADASPVRAILFPKGSH
ncbi:MAG: cyclase family protein [Bacteriovorax sp.]|nr:cyclase family protein [Bacteriovorax sp.]